MTLCLQEVLRINREHPDDNYCIVNDRVKGRLKVTRAFGAGFLKQVSCILHLKKLHATFLATHRKIDGNFLLKHHEN